MESVNPANGSVVGRYPTLSSDALERKIACAEVAYSGWREVAVSSRVERFVTLAETLLAERDELAELITEEMGKPVREARSEIDKSARLCRYYAEAGPAMLEPQDVNTEAHQSYVRVDPLGPVLGIMPWNYPVWQVVRFAVPCLLTGNVVLLKHAPNVTGASLALERLFHKAGLTDGIYSALTLEVEQVESVIADPRVAGVSLTGSVGAGQAVATISGRHLKPSVLELGGSDPFIVLDDADLDAAAEAAVASRTLNSGQSCIAAKRFIVESSVHDAFVARMVERVEKLRIGNPQDETTDIGPLARADLISTLHFQVTSSIEQGALCITGGAPVPRPGNYYAPTVLTQVERGMAVFDEETFGPVAAVCKAEHEAQVIELANGTLYGLGASVFGSEQRAAALVDVIEAGFVTINGFTRSDPRLPFGGVKHSGYGRELAREGVLAFSNLKTVWIQRP